MIFNNLIKKIEKHQLLGRGCNNFLVATKWLAVKNAPGKEKFVICNVSESEPGVFKDQYILEHWPEQVITGIGLAIKNIGATKGFIYLNPKYYQQFHDYLLPEIEAQKLNIEIYQKPLHDYVGGEETAIINALSGKRIEPRLKPPFPTTQGFLNQPTLVNNCETFYTVYLISKNEYKNTRFYCLSGAEIKPTVKELPLQITVKKMLESFGHKPKPEYFYQVGGGAAGFCYHYRQLNRPFDGITSVIVHRTETPEKNLIMHWLDFFVHESCGQCVPCREGTYRLKILLEKYYAEGVMDQKILDDLIFSLQNTSFCPLGKVSANAILSYWKNVCHKQPTVNN